ncbi:LacI family transcriptional regulator [Haloferula helveola]|uniref:LacI family transcriptional regulator n=1 Tax=Haloferula helveola TaxID=490095 RepID=A0ABM7RB82_9BACT|nr:LacI family transcriptional regulator [Haloferula helveola]
MKSLRPNSPAPKKRVRLKDVAERAGVAVNTASTILNRRPNSWASKETQERVFAAAKELGYRPNRAAVALQSGRFETIGLLVADLNNPYFTHTASILGQQVEALGYDLVIESWRTDLEREKKLLRDFSDRNVDGVVAFVSDIDSHRAILEQQAESGVPLVALAMPGAGEVPVDLVMPNFETGLREAAENLYAQGHRRFAFVAARSEGQRVGKRPALFEEMVAKLDGASLTNFNCGPSVAEAREAGDTLLASDPRPTAVLTLNDLTAIGVMRAATDAGLRVPQDISVVGIDGIPLGEQLAVSLSTVAQPHEAMMSKALEFLMARIEGSEEPPQRSVFDTHFVPRESSGTASA